MRISQASELVGLSAKTIRHYEAEDVIPKAKRQPNGYRTYDDQDVRRLRAVAAARALDLPLEDIRDLTELAESGRFPCLRLRAMAEERRRMVREAINDLAALEARLTETIERSAKAIDDGSTESFVICPVLEATGTNTA